VLHSIKSFSIGNISKILWPGKDRLRGKRLWEILRVEADNILSGQKFRNHFEHYYEELKSGLIIDLAVFKLIWP